jgi:hypothetical protein
LKVNLGQEEKRRREIKGRGKHFTPDYENVIDGYTLLTKI